MTAVKLKIMPSSPDEDLEEIKEKAKSYLEEKGAMNLSFKEEDIAFGLKAVIATFAWPESYDTDILDNLKAKGVSSVEIIDYRRAFG